MARRRGEREVLSMAPYVIDVARRRILITPQGVPTAISIRRDIERLGQEPTFDPAFQVLFELRALRALEVSTADMQALIQSCRVAREGRRALVVSLAT